MTSEDYVTNSTSSSVINGELTADKLMETYAKLQYALPERCGDTYKMHPVTRMELLDRAKAGLLKTWREHDYSVCASPQYLGFASGKTHQ